MPHLSPLDQQVAQTRAKISINLYGLAEVRKQLLQKTGILDLDAYQAFTAVPQPSLTIPVMDTDPGFQWSDLDPSKQVKLLEDYVKNLISFGSSAISYVQATINFVASLAQIQTVHDQLRNVEADLLAQVKYNEALLASLIQQQQAELNSRREQFNHDLVVGEVALYEGISYAGDVQGALGDINDVEVDALSIRLNEETGITVYADECFMGASQDIPVTVPTLAGSKLGDVYPRSVKVWSMKDRPYTGKWAVKVARVAAEDNRGDVTTDLYLSVKTVNDGVGILTVSPIVTERETFRITNIAGTQKSNFELPGLWFAPSAKAKNIWSVPFDTLQKITPVVEPGYRRFSLKTDANKWLRYSDDGDKVFYLNATRDERTIFSLALKVADDETQVGALDPGEIALYENPMYWGRVWVLNSAQPDFHTIPALANIISSVRLGPATAATLYYQSNAEVPPTVVRQDVVSHLHDMRLSQIGDDALTGIRPWRLAAPATYQVTYANTLSQDYEPDSTGQSAKDITVYRTTLEVPGAVRKVRVWTTDTAVVTIYGTTYNTDEDQMAEIEVRGGRLTVTMKAAKLTAPALKLQLDTMPADERIVIFPDHATHERLLTLEPDTLAVAKDSQGRDLIPTPSDQRVPKAAVAQIICDVVKSTVPVARANAASATSATRMASAPNLAATSWKLTFPAQSGAAPTFSLMSTTDAQAELAAAGVAALTPSALSIGDIFGPIDDWVKVTVDDIRRLVEQGVEFLVTQVGNALQVVIKGFENEVLKPLKDFVLSSAQAVAEFVEKVIEKIGVVVEEFVRFIRNLFKWENFKRSQVAIKQMVNHSLTRLEHFVSSAQVPVDAFFQQSRQLVEEQINALIVQLGETPAADPGARHVNPSFELPDLDVLNWLMDKILDAWRQIAPSNLQPPPIEPAYQQLLDSINNAFGTLAGSVLNVTDAILALIIDPQTGKPVDLMQYIQKPQLLAARLLNVVKQIALTGLTAGQLLVDGVIQAISYIIRAFQKMLNEVIQIPLLSDLFHSVIGIDLSLINIGTLLLAIPVTLVLGEPFQFSAPVSAMQAVNLQAMGTAQPASVEVSAAASSNAIEKSKGAVSVCCALINSNIAMILDTLTLPEGLEASGAKTPSWMVRGGASLIPDNPAKGLEIVSWLLSILEWGAGAPGNNWFVPDLAHIGADDGTPEYWSNVIWFVEMTGLVIDGISLISMGERARRAELVGVAVGTVFSVAQLGLVSKLTALQPDKPADNAEMFMGLWPGMFCSLRIAQIVEATYGISSIVVGQLDRVAGFVTFGVGVEALSKL